MASNKSLESKNKILQSLDFYTNNLLNVSKIVGNKKFTSATPLNLEISTRDIEDTNAGNLLLRAGTSTSPGTNGYVHIFAGSATEPEATITPASGNIAATNAKGIVVSDDNKVYIGTSESIVLQTTTPNNSITLANSGQTLTIKNTSETQVNDTLDITVNKALSFKGKSHSGAETPFEIAVSENNTPTQSKAVLTVSDINVTNEIKFGSDTGATAATRGKINSNVPISGHAGQTVLTQIGAFTLTGTTVSGSGAFSLVNPSTQEDDSLGKSLFTVQHENIKNRAYINNLDIYGNIRFGNITDIATGHPAGTSGVDQGSQILTAKVSTIDLKTTSSFKIDATEIEITGENNSVSDTLLIESQSIVYPGAAVSSPTTKSFVKAEAVQVTQDFYGNNVHMYWDADTNSLVFARV